MSLIQTLCINNYILNYILVPSAVVLVGYSKCYQWQWYFKMPTFGGKESYAVSTQYITVTDRETVRLTENNCNGQNCHSLY